MLNIDKHKSILIRILKDTYTDNTLGHVLGFKGGTAALLFYNLSRFSVDLDFDLLDPEQEEYVFEKESVTTCIEKLEKVSGRKILSGMGELLDAKQKAWVKTKLKTEILFLLKIMLDNEK
ncbi:MAG: nucleotidyl transferase AbiEii/AbiGii toxin family protein [Candidatus Kerfeldbacteria bacterium]|nr:nucleotidyl transferase AbiEii/AbiGii toxin family protein [Candidatus Kerfeldbacteria bacterium]